MSDDHRVGVGTGLHILIDFQSVIQFFGRLPYLLTLTGNDGHLDWAEAIFVFFEIVLQGRDELGYHDRWQNDS